MKHEDWIELARRALTSAEETREKESAHIHLNGAQAFALIAIAESLHRLVRAVETESEQESKG